MSPALAFDWPLPTVEVLYEVEQPLIFVTHTTSGLRMLALYVESHLASDDAAAEDPFVLVAPLSAALLEHLKKGLIGVREALSATWIWQVGLRHGVLEAQHVTDRAYEKLSMPQPGTPLYAGNKIPPHPAFPYRESLSFPQALANLIGLGLTMTEASDYLAPFFTVNLVTGAGTSEPGNVLPKVGTRVFILHGRDNKAHPCLVTGYVAYPSLDGRPDYHRVAVQLVYEGTPYKNERRLQDCWPTEAAALEVLAAQGRR